MRGWLITPETTKEVRKVRQRRNTPPRREQSPKKIVEVVFNNEREWYQHWIIRMTKRETHVHRFHHWWHPQSKESLQKDDEKEDQQVDIPQQEGWMHFNCDRNKVGGILNEIFPLVITYIISNFVSSQMLIYGSSSYDIMYSSFFFIIENGGEQRNVMAL